MDVVAIKPDTCVTHNIVPGTLAYVICCHEKIWREADVFERYGGLFGRACEECVMGECGN